LERRERGELAGKRAINSDRMGVGPVNFQLAPNISLTGVTLRVTLGGMIKSFRHKGVEEFFYTGSKKGIKPEHAKRLERILDRLNAASEIKDMNYPGSFLHQLSGDKKGFYAVKVSGNWRIFFQFIDGDAYVVDYDDYH